MANWRTRIEPFTRPLFFAWSRMSRGMTLGVRGAMLAIGILSLANGALLAALYTLLCGREAIAR